MDTANKYYNDIVLGEGVAGRIGKSLGRTAMMIPNMAEGAYHAFTDEPTAEESKLAINSPVTGQESLVGRAALAGKRMLVDPSVAAYQHVGDEARAQEARAAATGVPIAHPTRAKIAEGLGKVESAIPMVGPWALSEGERAGKGDIAGAMTDVGAMGVIPEVAKEAMPGGELSDLSKSRPTEGEEAFPTTRKAVTAPVRLAARHPGTTAALLAAPFVPISPLGLAADVAVGAGGRWAGLAKNLIPESVKNFGLTDLEVATEKFSKEFKDAKRAEAVANADLQAHQQTGEVPQSIAAKARAASDARVKAEQKLQTAQYYRNTPAWDAARYPVTPNAPDQDIIPSGVKSTPGTSMSPGGRNLIPEPKAPQGPLGRVGEPALAREPAAAQPTAEVPATKAPTAAEGVPPVAPRAAAAPPTATEPGLVGAEYKEAGGPGPEELHPVVKEQVALLRNAKLKDLGKAYGLNPEEYDFTDRQKISPSGSKHAVQRERLVNDVMEAMPPEEIQSIGRQAGDLENNAEMHNMHKADRAETLFPRLRKATPGATMETARMNNADLLKRGFTQADIDAGKHLPGVSGKSSVGEGLGNSGNSPPPEDLIPNNLSDAVQQARQDAKRAVANRQEYFELPAQESSTTGLSKRADRFGREFYRRQGDIAKQGDTPAQTARMHVRAEETSANPGAAGSPEGPLGKITTTRNGPPTYQPVGPRPENNTPLIGTEPVKAIANDPLNPRSGPAGTDYGWPDTGRGNLGFGRVATPENVGEGTDKGDYLGKGKYTLGTRSDTGVVPEQEVEPGPPIGTGKYWQSDVRPGSAVDRGATLNPDSPGDSVSLIPTTAADVEASFQAAKSKALAARTAANAKVAQLEKRGVAADSVVMKNAVAERRAAENAYQAIRNRGSLRAPSQANPKGAQTGNAWQSPSAYREPLSNPYLGQVPGAAYAMPTAKATEAYPGIERDLIPEQRVPSKGPVTAGSLEGQIALGNARQAIDRAQEESKRANWSMSHPGTKLGPREGEFSPNTGKSTSTEPTLAERLAAKELQDARTARRIARRTPIGKR